jgi:cytochrome b involved in lipid metabolism
VAQILKGLYMPKSWKIPPRAITLAELAAHSTIRDCWLAIEGNVYDVTGYLRKHPGGNVLMRGAGIDATELFSEVSKYGHEHSPVAHAELQHYYIGKLEAIKLPKNEEDLPNTK